MPISDPVLNSLARRLAGDGNLSNEDIDQLIDTAMSDGTMKPAERQELSDIFARYDDKIVDRTAARRLQAYFSIEDPSVRRLAYRLEKAGGSISGADVRHLIDLARETGRHLKDSLGQVLHLRIDAAAKAELESVVAGGHNLDLELPPIAGRSYVLSPNGHFTTGSGAPVTYDANGALTVYRAAAALTRAEGVPLAEVPTEIKDKMLLHLERAFEAGVEAGGLPSVANQRMRSGAASTLLCLIESCSDSEGELKQRALDVYFRQAMSEPLHNLRASMYFNLERIEGLLRRDDRARLETLKAQVIPSEPPYDDWFKGGNRQINVKHYAHNECFKHGDPLRDYRNKGYRVVEDPADQHPRRWILEKSNPDAPGGEIKIRIELIESHDGIFSSMDDPDTHVILYTGHSNLGGNVSEELRLGSEERGKKLILMALCRGKQNMFEVANKYPNAQFITTDQASLFSSVMKVALGVTEGVINRRDYSQMRSKTPSISDRGNLGNYFYPHEPRRYQHYDLDRDGIIDGRRTTVDRLYDPSLRVPPGTKMDMVVRSNDYDVGDLDGTKVLHAVQFINTLMTYHVDHGHHSSAFGKRDMDNFLSGGWFEGPLDELVRLEKEQVGGREMVRVRVNKGLADQSDHVLGALVQYEVVRQLLAERSTGWWNSVTTAVLGRQVSLDNNARAALFAGEYLAYMYCSRDEAAAAMRGIGRIGKMPGLNFTRMHEAISADGRGYVTDKQVKALRRLIRS